MQKIRQKNISYKYSGLTEFREMNRPSGPNWDH